MDCRFLDDMVVIEDKNERFFGDLINQAIENLFSCGCLGSFQNRLSNLTYFRVNLLPGSNKIIKKTSRIIIIRIEGEPGEWLVLLPQDIWIGLEVPGIEEMSAGLSPRDWAAQVVEGARALGV